MSAEIIEATKEETEVDVQKRAFMKKFGKYAAAGAGMSVLMTPASATVVGSGGNVVSGKIIQRTYAQEDGKFKQEGAWWTNGHEQAGWFKGKGKNGEEGTYDYKANVKEFGEGGEQYKFKGSWTFAENNKWSGSGDIFQDGEDVGDWKVKGTGFWGRFTTWWFGS